EVPQFLVTQSNVGIVEAGSPADKAGIQNGDRIVSLDDKKDPNWQDIESRIELSAGKPLSLILDRNGQSINTSITPDKKSPSDRGYAGMGPHLPVIVKSVWGEPAKAAGLQSGDEITAVNGIELKNTSSSIQGIIQGISAPDFPILVNRGGQALKFQITPVSRDGQRYSGSGQRYIGMDLQPPPSVTIK